MCEIFQTALRLHQDGDLLSAKKAYEQVLLGDSEDFEALQLLGALMSQLGEHGQAIPLIEKSLKIQPNNSVANYNLANARKALGQFESAAQAYVAAIELQPQYAQAYNNLGVTYLETQRLSDAVTNLEKAIEIKSDYIAAYYNLGNAYKQLGEFQHSVRCYQKVIQLSPKNAQALNNLGAINFSLGQLEDAIECFDRAINIDSNDPSLHANKAAALVAMGKLDEGLQSYLAAYNIDPKHEFLLGSVLHIQMKFCDWKNFDQLLSKIVEGISENEKVCPAFPLLSLIDDPGLQLNTTRIYRETKVPSYDCQIGGKDNLIIEIGKAKNKIRVGYYSSDFVGHATAHLIGGIFKSHDLNQFEIYIFNTGSHFEQLKSKSQPLNHTYLIDAHSMSDEQITNLSRQLEIDIAVDLNGYTQGGRMGVFAKRAAPLQLSFLGYPGTSACGFMDYVVADKVVIPKEAQKYFSEKVIYMPSCYQINDSARSIAAYSFNRQECGLPEDGFVYCCFNNSYKILPETFSVWTRILQQVKGSVLWLLHDNVQAESNLRKRALLHGIDDSRLIFAKRIRPDLHLARHRLADLFLDTSPYNAHTTASDALWAGLPVLTLIGKSFASRVAASLLASLDLQELITLSFHDYELLAVELSRNPKKLENLKLKLLAKASTSEVFDTHSYAKNLEHAFRVIHKRSQLGMQPDHIEVSRKEKIDEP
jgi:predicted O-linked N-acetylglucosamine transferase (SPINDLY family)